MCVDACVRWVHVVWRFGQRETESIGKKIKKDDAQSTKTHTHTHKRKRKHKYTLPHCLYTLPPRIHLLRVCSVRIAPVYIPLRTTSYIYCVCQPASQAKPATASQRARAEGAVRSGPRKRKSVGGKFSLEKIRNKSAERGRNLSRSWHKGHSHTYNTLF